MSEKERLYRLEDNLQIIIQRFRKATAYRQLALWLAASFLIILAGCSFDTFFEFSLRGRYWLSGFCYAMIALAFVLLWLVPVLRRINYEKAAWMLERMNPGLNERLISAVEVKDIKGQQVSQEMITRLLEDAEIDLYNMQPDTLFSLKVKHFFVPSVILIFFLSMLLVPSFQLPLKLSRVLIPSANDLKPGEFIIEFVSPKSFKVIEGSDVDIIVKTNDRKAREMDLYLKDVMQNRLAMTWDKEKKHHRLTIKKITEDTSIQARSGKITSNLKVLKVLRKPVIEQFEFKVEHPTYSKLEDISDMSRNGNFKVLVGSKLKISVTATQSLKKAECVWGAQVIPRELDESKLSAEFEQTISKDTPYKINLISENGLENLASQTYTITALPDSPPTVVLTEPTADLFLKPYQQVDFRWEKNDDFGFRKQELIYQKNVEARKSVIIDVNLDESHLLLSDLGCKNGDEIKVFIRVEDDIGQVGETNVKTISIQSGLNLENASSFIDTAGLVLTHYKNNQSSLTSINQSYEVVAEGEDDDVEMTHEKRLLDARLSQFSTHHEDLRADLKQLKNLAFFKKSKSYSELSFRYTQMVQNLETTSLGSRDGHFLSLHRFQEMHDLNARMIQGLQSKAKSLLSFAKLEKLNFQIKNNSKTKSKDELDKKHKELEEMAGDLNSAVYQSLKGMSDISQQSKNGLIADIYMGRKAYMFRNKKHKFKASKTKVHHSINFDNISKLGFGNDPVLAVSWFGFIKVPVSGKVQFFTHSDDGSRLYVDGKWVVNNDGHHGMTVKTGSIELQKGYHAIEVLYFNGSGPGGIQVYWQLPGKAKVIIPKHAFFPLPRGKDKLLFLSDLVKQETENHIEDYRELDIIAKTIREKLKSDAELLEELSHRVKILNEPEEWQRLEEVAENIKRNQENKTGEEQEEIELMIDAFLDATQVKDLQLMEASIEDLKALEAYQKLKRKMEDLKQQELDIANTKNEALNIDKEELSDRIDDLKQNLSQVQDALNPKDKSDQNINQNVKQAADQLDKAQQSAEQNNQNQSQQQLAQAEENIQQAIDQLAKELNEAEQNKDNALAQQKSNTEIPFKHLENAQEKMEELAKQLTEQKADQSGNANQLAQQLSEAKNDLSQAEEQLRKQAREQLENSKQSEQNQALNLAAAKVLKDILDRQIPKLENKLQQIQESQALPEGQKESQQEAGRQAEDIAHAITEPLQQLMQQQQANTHQLSMQEQEQQQEEALAWIEDQLDEGLQEQLAQYQKLQSMAKQVSDMAAESRQLEKQNKPQDAKKLGEESKASAKQLKNETEFIPTQDIKKPLNDNDRKHIANDVGQLKRQLTQLKKHQVSKDALEKEQFKRDLELQNQLEKIVSQDFGDEQNQKIKDLMASWGERSKHDKHNKLEQLKNDFKQSDKSLSQQLGEMSRSMQKLARNGGKLAQKQNHVKQLQRDIDNRTNQIKNRLNKANTEDAKAMKKNLDSFKDHVAKKDFPAAKRNLEALEKNIKNNDDENLKLSQEQEKALAKTLLEEAKKKSAPINKKKVEQAIAALDENQLEQAKKEAQALISDKKEVLNLDKKLDEAERFKKDVVEALKQAKVDMQHNLEPDANLALEKLNSNSAKRAQRQLEKAEKSLEKAIASARREAANSTSDYIRDRLDAAAELAENRNFHAAEREVQITKKDGRQVKRDLRKAERDFQKAKQDLDAALNEANKKMQNIASDTQRDATKLAQQAKLDSQKAQQASHKAAQQKNALQQAKNSLAAGKIEDAKKHANKANNDDLNNAIDKALQETQKARQSAQQLAKQSKNGNSKNRLNDAARNNVPLQHALNQSRAAGKDGQKAADQFAEAQKQAKVAEKLAQEAIQTQEQARRDYESAHHLANQDAQFLQHAANQAAHKQFEPASDHVQKASRGAHEAKRAADALARAKQAPRSQENSPMLADSDFPNTHEVAEAAKELENAAGQLQNGKANAQSSSSLQKAADQLQAASQALGQDISDASSSLSQSNQAAAASSQSPRGQGEQGNQPSNKEGEGGDPSGQGSQSSEQVANIDLDKIDLGKTWGGLDSDLSGKASSNKRNQYSPYYRKANQSYLQMIQRESKKWRKAQ